MNTTVTVEQELVFEDHPALLGYVQTRHHHQCLSLASTRWTKQHQSLRIAGESNVNFK